MNYIGLIHKTPQSDYGVSFPDFPGCITAGKTLDEARVFAEEALKGHVELMMDMGESVASPTSLESIMRDPNNKEAVVFLVNVPSTRVVRVNVCFPENILRHIDEQAHKKHMSRSSYLAALAFNQNENYKTH